MNSPSINDDYIDINDEEAAEELAADGYGSGVEAEAYSPYPFDVKKISISSRKVSLSNVVRRIERNLIRAAEIQRDANLWDDGRKSRLIESLMLKIPLPMFYAASDKNDVWTIVDGLQRTSAIRQYVSEKTFKLKELEYLKELENHDYEALPEPMKIRIDETELDFAVISSDSPPEIQRNIFKRLNTGGLPLTEQEIRYALYNGQSTDLLKELVNTEEFKSATCGSVKDSRMAAQELVLRFLAFSLWGVDGYKKNEDMDSFLTDTMQVINNSGSYANCDLAGINDRIIKNRDLHAIRENFLLAMKRSHLLFKEYAFRTSTLIRTNGKKNRTPINKSLFEAWSVLLGSMQESVFDTLFDKREVLFDRLNQEYSNSESALRRSIGQGSTKLSTVKGRHDAVRKIVNEIIGE